MEAKITDTGTTSAATYDEQLAARVGELLPDLSTGGRLELLGVMTPDEMRSSLAWLVSFAPQVFDFSLARDRALAERLQQRADEQPADDGLDSYCSACGASVAVFIGHGNSWHHYRGNGTVESPNELFEADHEPAPAWREAGAR